MKAEFYNLKEKKHVTTEVIGKRKTANGRFQIVGKSEAGTSMYVFVNEKDYNGKYASVKAVK